MQLSLYHCAILLDTLSHFYSCMCAVQQNSHLTALFRFLLPNVLKGSFEVSGFSLTTEKCGLFGPVPRFRNTFVFPAKNKTTTSTVCTVDRPCPCQEYSRSQALFSQCVPWTDPVPVRNTAGTIVRLVFDLRKLLWNYFIDVRYKMRLIG